MTSLFLNTSNYKLEDCPSLNISDTIETECLSVLHKLHDQVNGLQLVQVVVQPLAKLFAATSTVSTSTYMMSPDTAQALIARLDTDRDVNWLMEIIGYGLSMPFSITGEQDSVKDCCTIYCEWFNSALMPYDENNEDSKYQQLSKLVPVPIRRDPNRYARKMLSHLYNVFLPRQPVAPMTNYVQHHNYHHQHHSTSSSPSFNLSSTSSAKNNSNTASNNLKDDSDAILTAVSRQAVLCHRVLRTIESIAHNDANLMDVETWQHLLALLLTVNDKLLSPPTEPDDIGTQLQDRILGVLFDLMLLASANSVPDASLWKTFHSMCINWRHRPALVDHWLRITSLLSKRIVSMPTSPSHKNITLDQSQQKSFFGSQERGSQANSIEASISLISYDNLSQTWYRFLNLIGNPVELSDPSTISRTDEFYHSACLANSVLDPRQHPCLNVLPQMFLSSMLGVRDFVESFILSHRSSNLQSSSKNIKSTVHEPTTLPPSASSQANLNPDRPKCNSILHIFGDWLFSAALIGSELTQEVEQNDGIEIPGAGVHGDYIRDQLNTGGDSTISLASSTATATESGQPSFANSPMFARRQSHQSTTSSHTSISTGRGRKQSRQLDLEKITLEPPLSAESFESGQAEAMATLCKIFSSKSPNEDILPTYLARFYLCLQHCLNFSTGQDLGQPEQSSGIIKRHLLASVLTNSTALLQRDLDGVNLLIPSLIKAIEYVFECTDQDIPVQPPPRLHNSNRSGSIRQGAMTNQANTVNSDLKRACIMTLVNLLAYPLHFQDLAIRNCLDNASPTTTFGSLRPRLLKLLFIALQTEKDVTNMQILFGGLTLAIHDLATNMSRNKPSTNTSADNISNKTNRSRQIESGHSSLEISHATTKQANDDTISQSSFVFNSNDGFLIKSLHVTCHLLINIWKHDNLVSLAAIEVLTTIARVSTYIDSTVGAISRLGQPRISNNNNIEMKNEYMQTTKWICDYICNQCSRPPPAHSRDMHSTIVAAYLCLSVWFYNHPYLLRDNQCITTLMEVIELGVSGQKSKTVSMNALGVTTSSNLSKSEKQLKPSSMRVREAAESLLNICMVRTCHDGPSNLTLCDTVLNELDIVELFGGSQFKAGGMRQHALLNNEVESRRQLEAYRSFKYFSSEDSIIFALFEVAPTNNQQQTLASQDASSRDSVICLLRTPFGKHCWKVKFNFYSEKSREKIIANKTLGLIKRPFQQQQQQQATTPIHSDNRIFTFPNSQNKSLYFNQSARFFPATIENLPPADLDCLVTSLEEYVSAPASVHAEPRLKNDLDKMSKLFAHQVQAEQKVISECSIRIKRQDCEEPQQMNGLETARVIMTHFGLESALGSLVQDDRVSTKFIQQIRELDSQSVRTCDSVNIFYVRRQRTTPLEIFESVRERHNISVEFFEWLLELGQPVVVKEHNRWTGKRYDSTHDTNHVLLGASQKSTLNQDEFGLTRTQMLTSDHGGAIFDGDRMTLYWSDMCQELAFMVPHRLERVSSNIFICWLESHDDLGSVPCETLMSQELAAAHHQDECSGGQTVSGSANDSGTTKNQQQQAKISKDFTKYFISPMKNGLYRVNLMISCGRQWLALPLVDGMTVSKGMLASLLRESILNLCRRRRLDADSYQPPHVKRRLKIQEICNNHKISSRRESSEFYFNLFRSKASN